MQEAGAFETRQFKHLRHAGGAAQSSAGSAAGEQAVIEFNGRVLWSGLVLIAVVLCVMHLVVAVSLITGVAMPAQTKFNLNEENNLPTYFSSAILAISALLVGLIAASKKNDRDPFAVHWAMLAVIFLLLSVDEVASFHELLGAPVRDALGLTGFLSFAWVLPAGVFVLAFVYAYTRFLFALPRSVAAMFVLSGAIFVIGAMGMEMVSASVFDETNWDTWQYVAAYTVEEILEIAGILLFIRTLLSYVRSYRTTFTLRVN